MYLPNHVIPEVSNLATTPSLGQWFHDSAAPVLAEVIHSSTFPQNIDWQVAEQSTTTSEAIFTSTNEPLPTQTTLSVPTITVPAIPSNGTSSDQEDEFVAPLYLQVLGVIWLALLFMALVMISGDRISRMSIWDKAEKRVPTSSTPPDEQTPLLSDCLCRVPHIPLKPDCPCHDPSGSLGDDCPCHSPRKPLETGQRSARPQTGDRHARKHTPILRTAGGPPPWAVCGCDICMNRMRDASPWSWV